MHFKVIHGLRNKYVLAAVVSILVSMTFIVIMLSPFQTGQLSVAVGFEGEQNGIYGYQVHQTGGVVTNGNPLPSNYQWTSSTPAAGSVAVQVCTIGICSPSTNIFDVQTNPVSVNPLFGALDTVNYYVTNPNNPSQKMYVSGQVEQYTFNIDLAIAGNSAYYDFSGDTVWLTVSSTVWNVASTGPNNIPGDVFEAPLYGVVSQVTWTNQGPNQVSPGTNGIPLVFYTSPNTVGQTFASLINYNANTPINSSLNSVYAPDSRMQQLVYYPIQYQVWHPETVFGDVTGCSPAGCNQPSAHITVTLYTLRIGEYILTNPSTQQLQQLTGQFCGAVACVYDQINGFLQGLTNPFAQLEIYGVIITTVVVLMVVFVASIGGFGILKRWRH